MIWKTNYKLTWYIPNKDISKRPIPCSVYLEWKNIHKIVIEKKLDIWGVINYIKWKISALF